MSMTEGAYPEEVILSEANGHRSRESVTLASGQNLKAGTVLGIVTSGGAYAIADNSTPASNGTQTAKAILLRDCDASSAAKRALVLRRDAEVKRDALTFHADADGTDITALIGHLAAEGIIVRS
ncbi:MAG TPA: head decoration protein [Terricaulis sp.]|nr:head decoration protein [Terricaulis sp.]